METKSLLHRLYDDYLKGDSLALKAMRDLMIEENVEYLVREVNKNKPYFGLITTTCKIISINDIYRDFKSPCKMTITDTDFDIDKEMIVSSVSYIDDTIFRMELIAYG